MPARAPLIRRGEIQHYGPHTLSCESIESPLVDSMLNGVTADLLFSDPPWGDGNLKFWATTNAKTTGAQFTPLTYDALLDRIHGLIASHVRGHIMIETGPRWADSLAEDFKARYHNVRQIRVVYNGGGKMLPSVIVYASTDPAKNYTGMPVATHGYALVSELVAAVTSNGDKVIDPCCGMGYTAQACIDHGLVFYGNEFNAVRLSKTIDRFKKQMAA